MSMVVLLHVRDIEMQMCTHIITYLEVGGGCLFKGVGGRVEDQPAAGQDNHAGADLQMFVTCGGC